MGSEAIRPAMSADLPAVARLFDLYRQFYEMAPDEELALRFISERLEKGQSAIFVAEDAAGELVGFCQIYFSFCSVFAGPICVLNDLFVLPDIRGGGFGVALLKRAEDFAREKGAVRITLQTAKTNERAKRLYEANGWSLNTFLDGYSKRFA